MADTIAESPPGAAPPTGTITVDPVAGTDVLSQQMEEATDRLEAVVGLMGKAASTEEVAQLRAQYDVTKAEVERTKAAREAAERDELVVRLLGEVQQLKAAKTERKFLYPTDGTGGPGVAIGAIGREETAFPLLLWQAKRGNPDAQKRLWDRDAKVMTDYRDTLLTMGWGTKALAEGVSTTGGFLVPPEYLQQLVALRRATAPLLDRVFHIQTTSNLVYVPQQTGVSTVAWTAENATKVSTDEVLAQIAVNIYTLAGIAKVSNQLLEDSNPAVDQIVRRDLMRGLNIEMDRALINGSGTGQPTGILNTAGVVATVASGQLATNILDDILAAIGRMQAAFFGQPDTIVMSPRTWSKLLTGKDTTGRYLSVGTLVGNQTMNLPGIPTPTGATPDNGVGTSGTTTTLFGIPVVIDANMPNTLTVGGNTNRSAIIVGALTEAWAFDRWDIRMDVSSEAGTSFEQNQTWFRGECRMGFTAARLPSSFQLITDVGP